MDELNRLHAKESEEKTLRILSDCGLPKEHHKSVTPEILSAVYYLCKQYDELEEEVNLWREWISNRPF